jgi:hypothetical protein
VATLTLQIVRTELEIFSAGCAVCQAEIDRVRELAVAAHVPVQVHDTHDAAVAQRAQALGIVRVPAVVITTYDVTGGHPTSRLTACCAAGGCDEAVLRDALRAAGQRPVSPPPREPPSLHERIASVQQQLPRLRMLSPSDLRRLAAHARVIANFAAAWSERTAASEEDEEQDRPGWR